MVSVGAGPFQHLDRWAASRTVGTAQGQGVQDRRRAPSGVSAVIAEGVERTGLTNEPWTDSLPGPRREPVPAQSASPQATPGLDRGALGARNLSGRPDWLNSASKLPAELGGLRSGGGGLCRSWRWGNAVRGHYFRGPGFNRSAGRDMTGVLGPQLGLFRC